MNIEKSPDCYYMKMALNLAEKARGFVSPNPLVGAVIVKNDNVIGAGYHEKAGHPHAEINAIKSSNEDLSGATMYVTLEPCCHIGRTPPCIDAIIKSGIKKVVIGTEDPNPKVAGQGIKALEKNGITVLEGILADECKKINCIFFHYMKTSLPYITMKYAMTTDGKIATSTGKSKWITGEEAREHVHLQRSYYKAIMVGVNTVIEDDPMLTSRTKNGTGKNPIRIICDTNLRCPLSSKVVQTANLVPTIIATTVKDHSLYTPYIEMGCQIISVDKEKTFIDLSALMKTLGLMEIDSIILEGGSTLNWGVLEKGLVNNVTTYIAPKLFGGKESKSPIEGLGVQDPKDSWLLGPPTLTLLGEDILIEREVLSCSQE